MDKQVTNQEILALIKAGNESALSPIYEVNRKPFIRWAVWNYKCDESDAADIYQRAFTIFYFNVKEGKLAELSAKLETYLFGIGKRLFLEFFRQKGKQMEDIETVYDAGHLDTTYTDKERFSIQQKALGLMLRKLGDPCSSVLTMYYYHKFSMEAIAEDLGYKNDQVAKKKKYECLQKLKEIAHNSHYTAEDLLG